MTSFFGFLLRGPVRLVCLLSLACLIHLGIWPVIRFLPTIGRIFPDLWMVCVGSPGSYVSIWLCWPMDPVYGYCWLGNSRFMIGDHGFSRFYLSSWLCWLVCPVYGYCWSGISRFMIGDRGFSRFYQSSWLCWLVYPVYGFYWSSIVIRCECWSFIRLIQCHSLSGIAEAERIFVKYEYFLIPFVWLCLLQLLSCC